MLELPLCPGIDLPPAVHLSPVSLHRRTLNFTGLGREPWQREQGGFVIYAF